MHRNSTERLLDRVMNDLLLLVEFFVQWRRSPHVRPTRIEQRKELQPVTLLHHHHATQVYQSCTFWSTRNAAMGYRLGSDRFHRLLLGCHLCSHSSTKHGQRRSLPSVQPVCQVYHPWSTLRQLEKCLCRRTKLDESGGNCVGSHCRLSLPYGWSTQRWLPSADDCQCHDMVEDGALLYSRPFRPAFESSRVAHRHTSMGVSLAIHYSQSGLGGASVRLHVEYRSTDPRFSKWKSENEMKSTIDSSQKNTQWTVACCIWDSFFIHENRRI